MQGSAIFNYFLYNGMFRAHMDHLLNKSPKINYIWVLIDPNNVHEQEELREEFNNLEYIRNAKFFGEVFVVIFFFLVQGKVDNRFILLLIVIQPVIKGVID
jgi:hypothetical protein